MRLRSAERRRQAGTSADSALPETTPVPRHPSARTAELEASKRLQELLADGRKLATFLRNAVRQRYGNRSEKLVEFGLQPFRSRARPAKPPEGDPPPAPTPE